MIFNLNHIFKPVGTHLKVTEVLIENFEKNL